MNPEKLKKLQAQTAEVRIGGKGMPRRKKKIVHTNAATDDKKLQSTLKKLAVNNIPGIEEVNLIKNDGSVIHFNNPRTQASLQSNVFAITGHTEVKNVSKIDIKDYGSVLKIAEMLPGIINHLGPDGLAHLKRLANVAAASNRAMPQDDDDIPELVESFENAMNASEEAKPDEVNVDEAIESKKADVPTEVVD